MTILIVDGFNNFVRNFAANQTVTASGDLVGGVVGFINTIKWAYRTIQPKEIIVVWEQGGASSRRKSIDSGYKANSAKLGEIKEFNKFRDDGRPNPFFDENNKPKQLSLLLTLMECLPVYQLFLENTECDDIIAYLTTSKLKADPRKKVILSGDKDFYQLLSDPLVEIFDPLKKHYINAKAVKERFGVIPENVCLLRTMVGDNSDTIKGIDGIGEKTAVKLFSELADEEKDVAWLKSRTAQLMSETKKPSKALQSLHENFLTVEKNWKLMYLTSNTLSASQIHEIDLQLEERNNVVKKFEFIKILHNSKIQLSQDWDNFLTELKKLIKFEKTT